MKRDRLGKGLGALIGDYLEPEASAADAGRVPVRSIVPNPHQPRQEFEPGELDELMASIAENGLLQPLLVRPAPGSTDRYELVAGERRFRSVQRLGWDDVPVLVREMDDETLLVLALVENIQRSQLNAIEEAEGYQTLIEQFGMTQAAVAQAVGKNRATVANMLRLLRLPPSIRRMVQKGDLSMGHARALLSIEDPVRAADLARDAVRHAWSVREIERRCQSTPAASAGSGSKSSSPRSAQPTRSAVVSAFEEALCERLSTRVTIQGKAADDGKGSILIPFDSVDEFERIFELLSGRAASEIAG